MSTLRHAISPWLRRIEFASLWLAILAAFVASVTLPADALGPTTVSNSPATTNVNVGNTAVVNVFVSSVSNLYGAEIHLTFDPSLLRVQDANSSASGIQITPGPLLTGGSYSIASNDADNTGGSIDFAIAQVNPTAPVTGSGVLATIRFTGLAAGTSAVHFVTTGSLPSHLSDRDGFEITAAFQDSSITVLSNPSSPGPVPPAEVPEADTLLLLGSGGTGFAAYLLAQWRRRRA